MCYGCTQQAKEQYEAKNKIRKDAQKMANDSGHWYGIYETPEGEQIIRADLINGEPVTEYVSPKL